jgi:hypothetical protein
VSETIPHATIDGVAFRGSHLEGDIAELDDLIDGSRDDTGQEARFEVHLGVGHEDIEERRF